jgi:hypothetical protein
MRFLSPSFGVKPFPQVGPSSAAELLERAGGEVPLPPARQPWLVASGLGGELDASSLPQPSNMARASRLEACAQRFKRLIQSPVAHAHKRHPARGPMCVAPICAIASQQALLD